jgi:Ca2+-binding RTX toxin-like protein
MRTFAALLIAWPGAVALSVPAHAAAPSTCGGLRVTINLNQPDAPDPERPTSDVVLGTRMADHIATGAGDDVVCGGGRVDVLYLGRGDDRGYGGAGNDTIHGGGGNDTTVGGPGAKDSVDYRQAPGAVTIHLADPGRQRTGWGADTIRGVEEVRGSAYHRNLITGNELRNRIYGGAARDHFTGRGQRDELFGGEGDDALLGGPGSDYVNGHEGEDVLLGGGDRDHLSGWLGSDILRGGMGDDMITPGPTYGNPGSDLDAHDEAFGGPGADRFRDGASGGRLLVGGPGIDQVSYEQIDGPVRVDLASDGPQDIGIGGTVELDTIENLTGTWYDDELYGTAGANELCAVDGTDIIDGREGSDVCYYGNGWEDLFVNCEVIDRYGCGG